MLAQVEEEGRSPCALRAEDEEGGEDALLRRRASEAPQAGTQWALQ